MSPPATGVEPLPLLLPPDTHTREPALSARFPTERACTALGRGIAFIPARARGGVSSSFGPPVRLPCAYGAAAWQCPHGRTGRGSLDVVQRSLAETQAGRVLTAALQVGVPCGSVHQDMDRQPPRPRLRLPGLRPLQLGHRQKGQLNWPRSVISPRPGQGLPCSALQHARVCVCGWGGAFAPHTGNEVRCGAETALPTETTPTRMQHSTPLTPSKRAVYLATTCCRP